jgi:arylsulfatase A-like enzyme
MFRKLVIASTGVWGLSGCGDPTTSSSVGDQARYAPPNVVLIMADDLGYGDTSAYGGWIKTPNLEQLAQRGVQFTDFHSSGNVCSPTRAGLMTGLYQQRLGIPGVLFADPARPEHFEGIGAEHTTIAEVFKQQRWMIWRYSAYTPCWYLTSETT